MNSFIFPKPLSIDIRATSKCNLRCIMCDIWKLPRNPGSNELEYSEICSIIDSMREWGVYKLVITGGEPLLRKDIFEIINYAAKAEITVDMTTNGTLIDRRIAEKLVLSELAGLAISLDSPSPAVHDFIRGVRGTFEKTMKAVELLKKLTSKSQDRGKPDLRIWLAAVVMNQNLHELVSLSALAQKLGVPIVYQPIVLWNFKPYQQNVGYRRSGLWIQRERLHELDKAIESLIEVKHENNIILNSVWMLEQMKQYFRNPSSLDLECTPGLTMAIDSNGDTLPCWYYPPSGNVREATIQRIWRSSRYRAQLRRMRKCKNKCMLNCYFPPGAGAGV
jgi:MoaA/NifB/PqqE/SkfB family radical SAM enzyme